MLVSARASARAHVGAGEKLVSSTRFRSNLNSLEVIRIIRKYLFRIQGCSKKTVVSARIAKVSTVMHTLHPGIGPNPACQILFRRAMTLLFLHTNRGLANTWCLIGLGEGIPRDTAGQLETVHSGVNAFSKLTFAYLTSSTS
jgi:hypothetical protein